MTSIQTKWPGWTWTVQLMRKPEDKGLGDTLARVIGGFGGEVFKTWHRAAFGHDCQCAARQEDINQRYPYRAG